MEREIITQARNYIKNGDLIALQTCGKSATNRAVNIHYIFQMLFNCVCRYGTPEMLIWLVQVYYEFDVVNQIALRQLFFYGKVLTQKNNLIETSWFNDHILILVRT